MWRVAFDIGGTFTDFVLAGADVPPRFLKVASSPDDPARAVVAGFGRLLAEAGVAAAELRTILHATTVATNAIIERKGCPTALLTTDGFRDVLIIGRQKRYETHDLYMTKPPPFVPRRRTFEVVERVDPHGGVEIPLDPVSLDAAIDAVIASGAESVAVSFLHAYANPAHEQAVAARLRERAPALPVSLSSKISPKFREYERTSTTVANAYVQPIVGRYVERLEAALAQRGFENDMFIMQSAGGLVSPAIAAEEPVRIVESGPAAGVLMSALVGMEAGESHVVTFDMGGTTAKLGAVDAGEPAVTSTFEIDPIRYRPGSGLPINIPAVELLEIGAGGGSIARAELGVIQVGPESAGADPGPMCYRRGGARPTITDANLVLGYLNPDYFNAGELRLDREAAVAGLVRDICPSTRSRCRGGGVGRARGRERQYGARHADRLRRARPRPAPVRDRRLRGCRTGARGAARQGNRGAAGHRPVRSGCRVGDRAVARGAEDRGLGHSGHAGRGRECRGDACALHGPPARSRCGGPIRRVRRDGRRRADPTSSGR